MGRVLNFRPVKRKIQAILQRLLGFERYLFVFSCFKILTLRWDKKEGDFNHFLRMLPRDGCVLDIGANVGIMSVLLAWNCKDGIVYAFEPVPVNFRALRRVLRFFRIRNVRTFELALGAESAEIELMMPIMEGVRMQGLSHVRHDSIIPFDAPHAFHRALQVRLDDIPDFQSLKIHGIKLDVENYERFVLAGGMEILKRDKPLIYTELWDNENRYACFDLLKSLGYSNYVLEQGRLIPYHTGLQHCQNFFFRSDSE